jgi:hypothetical protein
MASKLRQVLEAIPTLLKAERLNDDLKINQGRILALLQRDRRLPSLSDYEFKVFSQWGEDGIIQHLVTHLKITNKTFIEFGVEDFRESNCRFLLVNNHWRGFVIDGSERNMRRLRDSPIYWRHQIACRAAFITRENISDLLRESGFDRDLGLLSIDIDGVDYYVLEALTDWRPAILIVEYNEAFGYDRAVSVPYDAAFVRRQVHFSNQYYGASLPAFAHLANQRGYALVGTNGAGSNAFFVLRELLNDRVAEVDVATCKRPAIFGDSRDTAGALTFLRGGQRAAIMADMPLIDVTNGANLRVRDLYITS